MCHDVLVHGTNAAFSSPSHWRGSCASASSSSWCDAQTLGRHMAATLAPTEIMRQGFVPDAFMDRLHLHIISTVRACRLFAGCFGCKLAVDGTLGRCRLVTL